MFAIQTVSALYCFAIRVNLPKISDKILKWQRIFPVYNSTDININYNTIQYRFKVNKKVSFSVLKIINWTFSSRKMHEIFFNLRVKN